MPKSALSNKPSRLALLFGLGALSATGAGAMASASTPGVEGQPGDLVLRYESGRIFCAENGGGFQPLTLADTAAARHLTALLQAQGGGQAELRIPATILAGDGGSGFHWTPAHKSQPPKGNAAAKTRGQAQPQPAPSDPSDRKAKG